MAALRDDRWWLVDVLAACDGAWVPSEQGAERVFLQGDGLFEGRDARQRFVVLRLVRLSSRIEIAAGIAILEQTVRGSRVRAVSLAISSCRSRSRRLTYHPEAARMSKPVMRRVLGNLSITLVPFFTFKGIAIFPAEC